MHTSTGLLALAASLNTASAAVFGFNYGAQFTNDAAKLEQDFANEFNAAKKLPGVDGKFTSARLYTMIQHGSSNEVIQAIPAAIESNTHLLLGLWASGDPANFKNEVNTLKKAIQQYPEMADLVDGISVGSEDLYRISEIGLKAPDAAPGVGPSVLKDYIRQVRDAVKGTPLSGAKIGHVDTWTAWANSSNADVAKNSDFIGFDAYPYFEDTHENSIENSLELFEEALRETRQYTGNTPIWVTETGWAVSGPTKNLARADTTSARKYWEKVACKLLAEDNMNTWWYTLHDASPTTPSPSFGILKDLNGEPAYDLSCDDVETSSASSSASKSSTKTASGSASSESSDLDSPGLSASNSVDATQTGGSGFGSGGYATGSAPMATGTSGSGSGSGSGSNSTETFVSPTVAPSAGNPTAPAAGGETTVATGAAVANGISIAGVFGAAAAAFLL